MLKESEMTDMKLGSDCDGSRGPLPKHAAVGCFGGGCQGLSRGSDPGSATE